jgi:6-phosphogluconate dehydrogenase
MQPGIVGLGKMGGDLALKCVDRGIDVVGHAKHGHPSLAAQGVKIAVTYDALARALMQPGVIYLSLPAGPAVDEVIGDLLPCLAKGDVLIDGGNSFYGDSVLREKEMRVKGIAEERKISRITIIWGGLAG